uniref:Glutathione transferase-like protein n=1 Tax=Sparassis latifolia TaxID=1202976 RepID=A0A2U8JGN2_9APHY|nr:glutathione transferase-like protein [Sparassis latifolia]
MSVVSYEVHYWPVHARGDVTRMVLEASGKPYKNVFINPKDWPAMKKQQRFGHCPWLVIHYADGTSKTLWEEVAILTYLADTLGFFPPPADGAEPALAKAECLAVFTSWLELADKFATAMGLPDFEERQKRVKKLQTETLPAHVAFHERLIGESVGPFYFGDKPTIADFMAVSSYSRMEELFGDEFSKPFPNLVKLVNNTCALPAIHEYFAKRRDFGVLKFDREQLKVIPVVKA